MRHLGNISFDADWDEGVEEECGCRLVEGYGEVGGTARRT